MRIGIERDGATARVAVAGKFDFSGRLAIKQTREELIAAADIDDIVSNLNEVTQVDSAALGMLLLARAAAGAAKKRIALECGSGRVREILEVANFGPTGCQGRARGASGADYHCAWFIISRTGGGSA